MVIVAMAPVNVPLAGLVRSVTHARPDILAQNADRVRHVLVVNVSMV